MRRIPILILIALFASGCAAGTARHVATVTSVSAHATLAAAQDTEMLVVCGKPTAPAPPACVTQEKHQEISAKLVTAFDDDIALAKIIRDWPATSGPPATIGELLARITGVLNYLLDNLPAGALKTRLLTQIGATK